LYVQKKMAKVLARIKSARGLDESEKVLWARSLAATPDERWQMNAASLRLLGSFINSAKKKSRS